MRIMAILGLVLMGWGYHTILTQKHEIEALERLVEQYQAIEQPQIIFEMDQSCFNQLKVADFIQLKVLR